MKIYRTAIEDEKDEHKGFVYTTSKRAAQTVRADAKSDGCKAETIHFEVKPTKKSIIAALNRYGGHADNG